MEDTHHLINAIKNYFKCSINWEGQNYLGLTLDWDYAKKYVDISMPGYIPIAFQNSNTNHQHVPKVPQIHGINMFTENTFNSLPNKAPLQKPNPQTKIVYNPSTAPSCTMLVHYTQPCPNNPTKHPPESLHQTKTK